MKKNIFGLLGILLLLTSSNCNKDNSGLFDVPMQVDFTIPAGANTFQVHYVTVENIPSTVASLIQQNGLSVEEIGSINPKAAIITSIFGNQNYDIFREVSVEIYSPGSDPDRSSLEAFYRDPVPENTGDDLNLLATLINAKPFLVEETFSLRVRMELRYIPQQFIESRLNFTFVVR